MNMAREVVRDRQQAMLATAAAERQVLRVRALARAARRAERAERQLARSWHKVVRLHGELAAAEQGH